MLSLYQLKNLCRVCMVKIEICDDEGYDSNNVVLSHFPEIESLIHVCLDASTMVDNDEVDFDTYMPNLCRFCFEKWSDFFKYYRMLMRTEEKLRELVIKELQWVGDTKLPNHVEEEDSNIFVENDPVREMDEQYETNLNHSFYQDHSTSSSSFDANQPVDFRNDNQQANMPQLSSTHQLFEESPNIITSHDGLLEIIDPVSSRSSLTEVNLSRQPEFRTSNRICGKQYFSQDNGLYRCEPCKTNFYDPQRYEAHIKIVHEEYKRPFKCQECGKAYKFEKNLLDHIADNHSNRPAVEHTCEICNKLYRSRTLLRSHMEKQHPEHNDEEEYNSGIAEQLKYQCQYCPKVFKSKYTFNYHSMSHHNHQVLRSKQFKCNECDTIFSCRSGLNQHKLSHLQYDERIKCDFEGCNVRFLKMDVKRRHIRLVHLKEKKHVCDICGESFGIMATLRHHRYIHTGEKPYTCYICGQAFRQRTAMKTHTKIHFPRTSKAKKLQKKH